ncbi:MAG: phage head closure protein [Anaerolineae bacterium]
MTVFESLLNNTFTVERRLRVSDGQGGWVIAYETAGTIEGRIRPTTLKERLVADRAEAQISHVLYCHAGENVGRGDRVTTGDLTVEVLGVREPSEADEHWEIDCLEIQEEDVTVGGGS